MIPSNLAFVLPIQYNSLIKVPNFLFIDSPHPLLFLCIPKRSVQSLPLCLPFTVTLSIPNHSPTTYTLIIQNHSSSILLTRTRQKKSGAILFKNAFLCFKTIREFDKPLQPKNKSEKIEKVKFFRFNHLEMFCFDFLF